MSVKLKAHLTHKNRDFDVSWEGGAYIDVRFGGWSTPTEVINVYDYEKGEITIPFTQHDLALELKRWVLTEDAEVTDWVKDNPDDVAWDWYAAYIENQRY